MNQQLLEEKVNYVVGFAFNKGIKDRVVLIKKNKPKWQKGLLNGVGGKIEVGESPIEAMQREFKEETGIDHKKWDYVGNMSGEKWVVEIFTCELEDIYDAKTITDEKIIIADVGIIDAYETIDNIPLLIQASLLCQGNPTISLTYKY